MTNSSGIEILEDFIGLFFPAYCLACEGALVKGEEIICTECLLEIPKTHYHLDHANPFYQKLEGRIPVKYVMAFLKFRKKGRVQHLLHSLKYKNHPEVGVMLGKLYANDLLKADYGNKFDLIVPVPIHTSRKRKRGYNQSTEFGKGLSEIFKIPCDDLIIERRVKTETQTRKTRLKRWENVSEVFKVVQPEKILNKRILLVDDVITTGATLEACGRSLLDAGCSDISLACIAAAQ